MASARTPVKSVKKRFVDNKYCRVSGEVLLHSGYFNIFSEKSEQRRLADLLSKLLESEVTESKLPSCFGLLQKRDTHTKFLSSQVRSSEIQ